MKQLSLENEKLRKELQKSQQRVAELEKSVHSPLKLTRTTQSKPQSLWDEIKAKLKNDTEGIKAMLANGTITVHDTDVQKRTLLTEASVYGNWEIVKLCINLGAARNFEWALRQAQKARNPHIEQLLLLSDMRASIGEQMENISNSINKQNGVIDNILNIINNEYDEKMLRPLIKDTLSDIMIKIIERKLVFSDDLLSLCWRLATEECNGDALKSKLWKTIQKVCGDIISSGDKRDWYWLKNCLLTSNIWFIQQKKEEEKGKQDDNEQYLFYELLKLVEKEEKIQSDKLGNILKGKAELDKEAWTKLINFNIKQEKLTQLIVNPNDTTLTKLDETKEDVETDVNYDDFWWSFIHKIDENQQPTPRQDNISNGLTATYNQQHLHQTATTTTFDGAAFYDYNLYLSELALLAQSVDDEFQQSMRQIFNIDPQTNMGGEILYTRGPVKLLERARSKAQTDYFQERFPTSANVLDFNRCSLSFELASDLLQSVDLFINKIRAYQSGNIIGIVRLKNGFRKYVDEYVTNGPQYADIKINVIIRGNQHNIIGEVQFLINRMRLFKKRVHNLYGIARNEEFYRLSVSKILPRLTDNQQQLLICAALGNHRDILKTIIYNNQKIEDIVKEPSVLSAICKSGNQKAFNLFSRQENILQTLFEQTGSTAHTAIERSIKRGHQRLIRDIFNIKGVKEEYAKSEQWRYRAVYLAFVHCGNPTAIDVLMEELKLDTKQLRQLFDYKYPDKNSEFLKEDLLSKAAVENSLEILQKLGGIMDKNQFIRHVFKIDYKNNLNAMEAAISAHKHDIIEYLVSYMEIKERYQYNENNQASKTLILRLIYIAFKRSRSKQLYSVFDTIGISKETIIKSLLSWRPTKLEKSDKESSAHKFHERPITTLLQIGRRTSVQRLSEICEIIGQTALTQCFLFVSDHQNVNGFEFAICRNKLYIIKYIFSLEGAIHEILNDKQILWRIIYWLSKKGKAELIDYVVSTLQIDKKLLTEMISFKISEPTDTTIHYHPAASKYSNLNIPKSAITKLLKE